MSEARFRIVLIEDSKADVFLVREALAKHGLAFQLEVLDDGEKAVEFLDRLDKDETAPCPHLALLDINLPKKSGDQVLERVRQSPRCRHIPVVVITSSDSPKDKAQVARLGATQYFRKSSKSRGVYEARPARRRTSKRRETDLMARTAPYSRESFPHGILNEEERLPGETATGQSRSPVRYKVTDALTAVKLEEHPGSTLRDPTGTLVKIPANVIIELEGTVSPSGLVNVLWGGNAFSVFYEDLEENAQREGISAT